MVDGAEVKVEGVAPSACPRRRGPRVGGSAGARAAIVAAARARFTAHGYSTTTLRAIARDAEVDPSLIGYYFSSKSELFAAAIDLPYNPHQVLSESIDAPVERLGEVLTRAVLRAWDEEGVETAARGVIQSTFTGEDAFRQVREYVTDQIMGPLADALEVPDAHERAALALTHLFGLVFARRVVGVPPLADLTAEDIVAWVAPTVQAYLTGPRPSTRSDAVSNS